MIKEYKKFLKTVPEDLFLLEKILVCSKEEIINELNRDVCCGWVFDDVHVHYPKPRRREDLELLLEVMFAKLDRTTLTYWDSVENVLRYQELVKLLESGFNNYNIDNRGNVSIIRNDEKKVVIYPSQEIRTNSHLHITAEGLLEPIEEGLEPRKTIELIHKKGGITIIEHPCTKECKIKQYSKTNDEEDRLTLDVFELADAAEGFNSFNTLWMAGSNERARNLIGEYNNSSSRHLAMIAGSDTHYGCRDALSERLYLRHIGKAGTYLPSHDLDGASGEEIIEMKREDLRNGRYKRCEGYAGVLTFLWTMIPPIILRKLGIDRDSVS